MLYTQPKFTLPVSQKAMSREEYEIRVGVRCQSCRKMKCQCREGK